MDEYGNEGKGTFRQGSCKTSVGLVDYRAAVYPAIGLSRSPERNIEILCR